MKLYLLVADVVDLRVIDVVVVVIFLVVASINVVDCIGDLVEGECLTFTIGNGVDLGSITVVLIDIANFVV